MKSTLDYQLDHNTVILVPVVILVLVIILDSVVILILVVSLVDVLAIQVTRLKAQLRPEWRQLL